MMKQRVLIWSVLGIMSLGWSSCGTTPTTETAQVEGTTTGAAKNPTQSIVAASPADSLRTVLTRLEKTHTEAETRCSDLFGKLRGLGAPDVELMKSLQQVTVTLSGCKVNLNKAKESLDVLDKLTGEDMKKAKTMVGSTLNGSQVLLRVLTKQMDKAEPKILAAMPK